MALTENHTTADSVQDGIDIETETETGADDEAQSGDNVALTADDEVIDGEVTLPGDYADCEDAEGRLFSLRITNRERILWERTARKHQWGEATDSPHEALTFMAWHAARRTGDPAGQLKFEQFVDQVIEVKGRQVARVRPTR